MDEIVWLVLLAILFFCALFYTVKAAIKQTLREYEQEKQQNSPEDVSPNQPNQKEDG